MKSYQYTPKDMLYNIYFIVTHILSPIILTFTHNKTCSKITYMT